MIHRFAIMLVALFTFVVGASRSPGARQPPEAEVQRGQGDRSRRLLPLLVHQRHRQERRLRRQQQYLGRLRGLRRRHRRQLSPRRPATSSRPSARRPRSRSATSSTRTTTATTPTATPSSPRPAPAWSPRPTAPACCASTGPGISPRPARGRPDARTSPTARLKVPDLDLRRQARPRRRQAARRVPVHGPRPHPGDAVAYLPKHKILCTGDACVNGAYNFMGHSDSASWIRCLERCSSSTSRLVCPGHGPLAGKELLEKQKRYFVELRQQVQKGIDAAQERSTTSSRRPRPALVQGMDRRRAAPATTSSMSTAS